MKKEKDQKIIRKFQTSLDTLKAYAETLQVPTPTSEATIDFQHDQTQDPKQDNFKKCHDKIEKLMEDVNSHLKAKPLLDHKIYGQTQNPLTQIQNADESFYLQSFKNLPRPKPPSNLDNYIIVPPASRKLRQHQLDSTKNWQREQTESPDPRRFEMTATRKKVEETILYNFGQEQISSIKKDLQARESSF